MKRKCILMILIITILMNSIVTIPISSIATVEEGVFTGDEWKYNIKVVKVATVIDGRTTYMLDDQGRLWKNRSEGGIEHVFKTYRFSDIACGSNHTLALDKDGYLLAWGYNGKGQLGNGTTASSDTPIQIQATKQFNSIACSNDASFALDKSGNLYAWGSNKFGESDDITTIEEKFSDGRQNIIEISKEPQLKLTNITKVNANFNTILAIDTEGYAWGWGEDTRGQLGSYNKSELTYKNYWTSSITKEDFYYTETPIKLSNTIKFKDIAVGNNHSILVSEDGIAYETVFAQYGGNTLTLKTELKEIKTEKVLAGYNCSLFMDESHNIWTCGNNYYGTLGNGNTVDSETIVRVQKDANVTFVDFAMDSADRTIFVLDSNGELWGWGRNDYKQLSIGNSKVSSPIQITEQKTEYTVIFKNGEEVLKTQKVLKGQAATAPEIPTKPGYTFSKWDKEFDNVTSNLEVNAEWTPNTNTPYTVEYYYQQDNGTYPETTTTKINRTGTTLATVEVTNNDKIPTQVEGKTYVFDSTNTNNVLSGVVAADGSTVLKVYFKQQYTVTYKPGTQGTFTEQVKTGNDYNVNTPEFEGQITGNVGYTFAGWSPELAEKVTGNVEYVAVWVPGTATAYTVEHYKQNLSGTYDKVTSDTEHLTGTTGADVQATAKPYEGYHENQTHGDRLASGKIKADGSLVLKLYYDLNEYTVTFKDGDTVLATQKVKYGAAATAPTPTKEGHTFVNWDKTFNNITSDLVVNSNWRVNTYKVTLNTNGGAIAQGAELTSYTYGVGATLPIPTKPGYTFAGWYNNSDLTGDAIANIGTNAVGDRVYFAKWTANTNTPYTVEYYYQQDDGSYTNTATTSASRTGVTEQTVEVTDTDKTPTSVEGKTYVFDSTNTNNILNGIILGNGDTVLKVYFKQQYTVTYKPGTQGTFTEQIKAGIDYNMDTPAFEGNITGNAGYIFAGWTPQISEKVTNNAEYVAIWTPGTGTAYTVEHYKQNLELNGYDLVTEDVKHLTGTTGATATIIGKTYEGFTENLTHPDRIESGEILADGSLVLRLYYDRNTYTVELDTNGGTIKKEDEIKDYTYGKETTLPIPEKEGYTFSGWYDNSDFEREAITTIEKGTTGDKNYYAKWEIREYTVTFVNDGKIVKTETVVYGQKATAPILTRNGYILSWDKDFSNVKSDLTINAVWTKDPNYVDPNDGKEETPSKLPQTGENYMIIGTMSVLISAAIFVYLKYRKLGNM